MGSSQMLEDSKQFNPLKMGPNYDRLVSKFDVFTRNKIRAARRKGVFPMLRVPGSSRSGSSSPSPLASDEIIDPVLQEGIQIPVRGSVVPLKTKLRVPKAGGNSRGVESGSVQPNAYVSDFIVHNSEKGRAPVRCHSSYLPSGSSSNSENYSRTENLKNVVHKVPDIQLINKYYGLVPKKFVINERNTRATSKDRRTLSGRSKSGTNLICSVLRKGDFIEQWQGHEEKNIEVSLKKPASMEPYKEKMIKSNEAVNETGVIAKKMSFEKSLKKKWKKSLTANILRGNKTSESNTTDNKMVSKHATTAQQELKSITIDLKNIVCYENKSGATSSTRLATEVSKAPTIPISSVIEEHSHSDFSDGDCGRDGSGEEEAISEGTIKEIIDKKVISGLTTDLIGKKKSWGSRKTVSFDERLLETEDREKVLVREESKACHEGSQRRKGLDTVLPWTKWAEAKNLSISEKRSKFQRAHSIDCSQSTGTFESVDGEDSDGQNSIKMSKKSSILLTSSNSRKQKPVLPPPEVTTLVSQLVQEQNEVNVEHEIEKIADLLNQCHLIHKKSDKKLPPMNEEVNSANTKEGSCQCCNSNNGSFGCIGLQIDESIQGSWKSGEHLARIGGSKENDSYYCPCLRKKRDRLQKSNSISCVSELITIDSKKNESKSSKPAPRHFSARGQNTRNNFSARRSSSVPNRSGGRESIKNKSKGPKTVEEVNYSRKSEDCKSKDNPAFAHNKRMFIKKALIDTKGILSKKNQTMRPRTAPTAQHNSKKPSTATHHDFRSSGPTRIRSSTQKQSNTNITNGVKVILNMPKEEITTDSNHNSSKTSGRAGENAFENCKAITRRASSSTVHRMLKKQSFSMDDEMLLDVASNRIIGDDDSNAEYSVLNSKKREECLRIYEKMTKKGCLINLDTIFRGMMTPSEYRNFIKVAEKIAAENKREEEASSIIEMHENSLEPLDAGV